MSMPVNKPIWSPSKGLPSKLAATGTPLVLNDVPPIATLAGSSAKSPPLGSVPTLLVSMMPSLLVSISQRNSPSNGS